MTMGDRIQPGQKKFTDSSRETAESTNPSEGLGAQGNQASTDLREPHIEPLALKDAPGS